jgi:hypothetical protein
MHNTNVTVADQNTVINSNVALFDSQYLNAISTFAQIMAQGTATVPKHLQGNQADCMGGCDASGTVADESLCRGAENAPD